MSATERQRRYRQRQRKGWRVYEVEVSVALVETLIDSGLLAPEQSQDRAVVGSAIGQLLAIWIEEVGERKKSVTHLPPDEFDASIIHGERQQECEADSPRAASEVA